VFGKFDWSFNLDGSLIFLGWEISHFSKVQCLVLDWEKSPAEVKLTGCSIFITVWVFLPRCLSNTTESLLAGPWSGVKINDLWMTYRDNYGFVLSTVE